MPCFSDKKLSIVIPLYNEAETVAILLDKVWKVELPWRKEIIIVNDGSEDDGPALVKTWIEERRRENPAVELTLLNKDNGGKGSAVRMGIARSGGDALIIQDADLEYDPEDYRQCVEPIMNGSAKAVYGSREKSNRNRLHSAPSFYLGGLMVTYWMNLLFNLDMTDEPTCYKAFDGDLIRAMPLSGDHFEWEPEVTAKLARLGYDIHEVAINYYPRGVDEGKKINWRDGVAAMAEALRWRLAPLPRCRSALEAVPSEQPLMERRSRRAKCLWALFFISLAARLLLAAPGLSGNNPAEFFSRPDTAGYVNPALAMLENGRYSVSPDSSIPASLRPPGFPLLLTVLFAIPGDDFIVTVLALCLLGALTIFPVYWTGRLFGGHGTGMAAGLLFALNPTALAASPLLLSDTLFVFLVAIQLWFFTRFHFKKLKFYLLLSAFAAGCAVLVRPTNLLWFAPCVFLVLIEDCGTMKTRFTAAALALALFFAPVLPWMLRNAAVEAGFTISTNSGRTLRYHNGAVLRAKLEGGSPEKIRRGLMAADRRLFDDKPEMYATEASREEHRLKLFKQQFAANPIKYLWLHCSNWPVLLPDAPSFLQLLGLSRHGTGTFDIMVKKGVGAAVEHYFGGRYWLLAILAPLLAVAGLTYAGCAVCLLAWLLTKRWVLFFMFLAFVEYYLFMPGPITMPRYHLPALPMMCVMAAMAVQWIQSRRSGAPDEPLAYQTKG